MSITNEGIEGEKLARQWLIKNGFPNHQQIDWFVKNGDKYFIVEVKQRELFNPPPFYGTGLDIRQINLRLQLLFDLGIDTLLLVYEKNTENIYWNYLSELEKTEYFDTKNGIRIYNIKHYNRGNYEMVRP